MAENIINNPFVGCTARDMKYGEVKQYWCSPFRLYNLNESELLIGRTPIVIEGVRGTGKTMILKYLSYFIQKESCNDMPFEDKLAYFRHKSVGVYFRYKTDFCNLVSTLDCSSQNKERIFKYYYELFIIRQVLEILEDFYHGFDNTALEELLCDFFELERMNVEGVRRHVNKMLRDMDQTINSSVYDEGWMEKAMLLVGSNDMVLDLIHMISNSLPGWENILFVILLDEYENLGMFQATINTLIKQVDDTVSLTYRLGMRPAGMGNNNGTNVAGEHLQVDRDFVLRRLEFESFSEYKKFAVNISKKRLESVEVFRTNNLCDINTILGDKEDFDAEADSFVKGIRHFKVLKAYFPDERRMQEVIGELSCDEKLMEMYNVLRVMRGGDYKEIGALCRKYRELRDSQKLAALKERDTDEAKKLKKYQLDYSGKYRVALLYVLLTIYGERKKYYSFNTFLRLSSGSINDFISLCRNTFKHINEDMLEDLKGGQPISTRIQTLAAMDTAEDQRRKVAMSNHHGNEMYTFIDNMGSIFEMYHRDLEAKYPETNQFAFADENEIRNDNELNMYLVELINSGAVIRKPKRQLKSFGNTARGYLYQLNRIFAPIYQYSYRTRGGFNPIINKEDFSTMLHKSVDSQKYVSGNRGDIQQFGLFDSSEEDTDEPTDL